MTSLTPEEFKLLLPAFERAYLKAHPVAKTMSGKNRERKSGGGSKRSACQQRAEVDVCIGLSEKLPSAIDYGRIVWHGTIASQ